MNESGSPSTATTANPGTISYSASGTFWFSLKVLTNAAQPLQAVPLLLSFAHTRYFCFQAGTSSQLTGSPCCCCYALDIVSLQTVATVNNTD
jgi:hypothetical protein